MTSTKSGRASARPFFSLLLLVAVACASGAPGADIPKPKLQIIARTNLSDVAPTVRSGIAMHYEVQVTNQAQVPITLKRLDLDSLAGGGYGIEAKTRLYDVTIAPGETKSVDFDTTAYIDPSTFSSRSPVAIRANALFDSPAGKLQTIAQQRVSSVSGD